MLYGIVCPRFFARAIIPCKRHSGGIERVRQMSEGTASMFGALLRRYRIAAGLTQETLAVRAGLSPHGISDLERGARRTPRHETVRLLANALDLSREDRDHFEGAACRSRAAVKHVSDGPLRTWALSTPLTRRRDELAAIGRFFIPGESLLLVPGEFGIRTTRSQQTLQDFVTKGAATLYGALAQLYVMSGQYAEQLHAAEQAAGFAQVADDQPLLAQANMCQGTALLMLGRLEEALHTFVGCLPALKSSGNLCDMANTWHNIARIYQARGEFIQQRAAIEEALEAAGRCGEPTLVAFLRCARGEHSYLSGDWVEARKEFDEASALLEMVGVSWATPYPLLGQGTLLMAQGHTQAATGALEAATGFAQNTGDHAVVRSAQIALAEAETLRGEGALALARLRRFCGDVSGQDLTALALHAWACMETGDTQSACALLERAEETARAQDHRVGLVETLHVRARVMLGESALPEAVVALDEASRLAHAMPYPYAEAKLSHVYALIYARSGAVEQARRHMRHALAICQSLGERLYAEAILAALALHTFWCLFLVVPWQAADFL
jgi:tetratricopeptide (TPR) repeat protein